jgi:RNA polymerase sigma factor (sigma-70 family)
VSQKANGARLALQDACGSDLQEYRVVTSDAELVGRVRHGDVEAFGLLIQRYEKSVVAVALAELRDVHLAEDVAQEALLLAFRRLHTLRNEGKFGPWLMQIVRRQVVEAVRARQTTVTASVSDWQFQTPCDANGETWIENEHLLALVAGLPERERLLIGLRYFDGHSMAEIAEITARSVGTVTKQLSRATARLRSWWDKENRQ